MISENLVLGQQDPMLLASGAAKHHGDRGLWQRPLPSEHPGRRGRDRRDWAHCIHFQEMPHDHCPHMASYYERVKDNPLIRSETP